MRNSETIGLETGCSHPFVGIPFFCLSSIAIAVLVFAGGCGDGRVGRVPVSGSVTVDGKPLEFGSISFVPGDGSRPGGGSLEAGGKYRISTFTAYDGLPLGKYSVSISGIEAIGETAQRWHSPKKYSNSSTSELSVEIEKKTDELNFELTWKGAENSEPFVEKL